MITPGQAGPGFRVAARSAVSPSVVNVPSHAAVTNYVAGTCDIPFGLEERIRTVDLCHLNFLADASVHRT